MKTSSIWTLILLTVSGVAHAQSNDPFERLAPKKFAECVVVETNRSTTTTPVQGEAVAGCETGGGGVKHCSVGVAPNQPDYILNTAIDRNGPYSCVKLDGDNPCAFVQPSPIIFNSERSATRTFTTNSDRVLVIQSIPQLKLEQKFEDFPQKPRWLYTETKFSIAIKKSMFSARLECTLTTGDQVIYPVVEGKDLSDKIKFVSKNASDPALEIYTYQVGK